tara:strand:+ start:1023 stop:1472 length:450 start_codon:yes stop_codon:yes gene_type:complete
MRLKAQSAIEYLMIIALTLGIIVPTAYLFFRYTSESSVEVSYSKINQIGRNIIDTAETVYYSGEGSKIVLEVNMPEGIDDIYVLAKRELVFKTFSEIGDNEMVFFSSASIPLTEAPGDLSVITGEGLTKIKIEAIDDGAGGTEVRIEKV